MIYEDNQSYIVLAGNPLHHTRMKHINIKYYFIREHSNKGGGIDIIYCSTQDIVADILTKPLARPAFEKHI